MALRSQSATSKEGRGGRRYAPYVFTEQGVAMLSGVLRSKTAVAVNIAIMRAFVELRRVAASYTAIGRRLEDFERETKATLGQHDQQLDEIFQALRHLQEPELPRCLLLLRTRLGSSDRVRPDCWYEEWSRLLHDFYDLFPTLEHFSLVTQA